MNTIVRYNECGNWGNNRYMGNTGGKLILIYTKFKNLMK